MVPRAVSPLGRALLHDPNAWSLGGGAVRRATRALEPFEACGARGRRDLAPVRSRRTPRGAAHDAPRPPPPRRLRALRSGPVERLRGAGDRGTRPSRPHRGRRAASRARGLGSAPRRRDAVSLDDRASPARDDRGCHPAVGAAGLGRPPRPATSGERLRGSASARGRGGRVPGASRRRRSVDQGPTRSVWRGSLSRVARSCRVADRRGASPRSALRRAAAAAVSIRRTGHRRRAALRARRGDALDDAAARPAARLARGRSAGARLDLRGRRRSGRRLDLRRRGPASRRRRPDRLPLVRRAGVPQPREPA